VVSFDTIPKEALLAQDVMEGLKRWTPIAGTPQGSVISPLMSKSASRLWMRARMSEAGHRYVRFADDFVALCRTRQEAEPVHATIQAWVEQKGLRLHPGTTRVGNCMEKGGGVKFLG
jgi:RNA-directed DNA polymerase